MIQQRPLLILIMRMRIYADYRCATRGVRGRDGDERDAEPNPLFVRMRRGAARAVAAGRPGSPPNCDTPSPGAPHDAARAPAGNRDGCCLRAASEAGDELLESGVK